MLNNKGVALITTLLLSLIALIFIGAVMELTLTSTKLSGYFKTYASAEEAAKGAINDFFSFNGGGFFNINSDCWIPGHNCKAEPVEDSEKDWPTKCPKICSNLANCESHASIKDIINYPDWKKSYGDYTVYAKITKVLHVDSPFNKNLDLQNYWLYTVYFAAVNNKGLPQRSWFTVVFKY